MRRGCLSKKARRGAPGAYGFLAVGAVLLGARLCCAFADTGTNGVGPAVPETSGVTTARIHVTAAGSVAQATNALASAEDPSMAEFRESLSLYGRFLVGVRELPVYVSRGLLLLLGVAFVALLIGAGWKLRGLIRRVTERQKALELGEMERALPTMIAAYEKARIPFARERAERVAHKRDPGMVPGGAPLRMPGILPSAAQETRAGEPQGSTPPEGRVWFFQNTCRACGEWVALPVLDPSSRGELLYQTEDGASFARVSALGEPAWERVTAILYYHTRLPLLREDGIRLIREVMRRLADPLQGRSYTRTFPLCPLCGHAFASYDDRTALFDQPIPKVTWHHFLALPAEEQVAAVLHIVEEENKGFGCGRALAIREEYGYSIYAYRGE